MWRMWRQRRSDVPKTISRRWDEHMRAEFPATLRGEEVAGVNMVMLDADIAGCIVAWRSSDGHLDEGRQQVLTRRLGDLDRVMPLLHGEKEHSHYERLGELGRLVAERFEEAAGVRALCPSCGHEWREHIPPNPCSECLYEIEHGEPNAPSAPCERHAPSTRAEHA